MSETKQPFVPFRLNSKTSLPEFRSDFIKHLLQQRLTRWKIVHTRANVVGSGLAALACLALRPGCKGPLYPGTTCAVGKANMLS